MYIDVLIFGILFIIHAVPSCLLFKDSIRQTYSERSNLRLHDVARYYLLLQGKPATLWF